jgi:hypothetical protein
MKELVWGRTDKARASLPGDQIDQQIVCGTFLLGQRHNPIRHRIHILDAWPNEPLAMVSLRSSMDSINRTRIIFVKRKAEASRKGSGAPFNILLTIRDVHVETGCPS